MNMDFAASQSFDDVWIYIDAENFDTMRGKSGGGWQADIAKTKNTYFFEVQGISYTPTQTPNFPLGKLGRCHVVTEG
jgi:hypothetical protein